MRAYGTNLFANKATYLQTETKGEKNKKARCNRAFVLWKSNIIT
jgi:hypothetical protein